MYFRNSHDSRDFPIPPMPTTDSRCSRPSSIARMEQILHQAQLTFPADERGFEPLRPELATTKRDHADGARDSATGSAFPLSSCWRAILVHDRCLGRSPRGVRHRNRARLRRRLHARGSVHEIAGHEALSLGPDRHGRLPGRDPCARGETGGARVFAKDAYRIDQIETGAHRALGVIFPVTGVPRPPSRRRR